MDLGFKLAVSNRNLKHPTSRQIFGDTSGLLCKNDQILRLNDNVIGQRLQSPSNKFLLGSHHKGYTERLLMVADRAMHYNAMVQC